MTTEEVGTKSLDGYKYGSVDVTLSSFVTSNQYVKTIEEAEGSLTCPRSRDGSLPRLGGKH